MFEFVDDVANIHLHPSHPHQDGPCPIPPRGSVAPLPSSSGRKCRVHYLPNVNYRRGLGQRTLPSNIFIF